MGNGKECRRISFPGSLSNPASSSLLMLNHESDPRGSFPRTSLIGSM